MERTYLRQEDEKKLLELAKFVQAKIPTRNGKIFQVVQKVRNIPFKKDYLWKISKFFE